MKTICGVVFVLFMLMLGSAKADDVILGDEPGSIVYSGRKYLDIVGEKDGSFRRLTKINSRPALYSGGRDSSFYLLKHQKRETVIDCAYIETRNGYNGAGVYAGVCGLERPLDSNYDYIIYDYSEGWIKKIYSFDTGFLYRSGKPTAFYLGNIGELEVYNLYRSRSSLESATPEVYVKSSRGCYYINKMAFLVFLKGGSLKIKYLDVKESEDPMVLRRLGEKELQKVSIEKCQKYAVSIGRGKS